MNRMSFEAFKKKAEEIDQSSVMKKIKGGSWSDCHGFWGQVGKAVRGYDPSDPYQQYLNR